MEKTEVTVFVFDRKSSQTMTETITGYSAETLLEDLRELEDEIPYDSYYLEFELEDGDQETYEEFLAEADTY